MANQIAQSGVERVSLHRFANLEQHRLIPVMRRVGVLGEEPFLDRREADRTGDAAGGLARPRRGAAGDQARRQPRNRLLFDDIAR